MRKGLVSTSPFPFSDSLSSMLNLLLLLLVLGPPADGCESAPEGLTQAVTAYWHALEKHDKVTAMQFVYSEDLNSFLNRQDADLRNTQCVGINLVNDETAKVLVSFDRAVLQTYLRTEATDTWVKTEQGWKVRVEKPASVTDRIFHAIETMPRPPLPARLDVLPKRLAFYAISPQQTAPLQIRNGLDLPAEVVSLDYDASMLTIVKSVTTVPSHSTGRIAFRYSGPKLTEENVEGRITLKIRQGDATQVFEIPVFYNYMNDLERWFTRQKKVNPTRPPK
jgi:hypothetical protein